jgi:fructosamine-3-kinase
VVVTGHALPQGIQDWVTAHIGQPAEATLLSTSNSTVWRVRAGTAQFVVKHLTDRSSTPETEHEVLRALAGHPRFRRVTAMSRLADGSTAILAGYVPGRLLADALATAAPDEVTAWTGQLRAILAAVNGIPVRGFGPVGAGLTAPDPSWSAFLTRYLDRQRAKAPALSALRGDDLAAHVARVRTALDRAVPEPVLLSADVNNRNFVVGDDGLVCVNMPVCWAGDPACPYGEAVLHWAGTAGADLLAAACGAPAWRLHLYAAYHAYVILAYVERFGDRPLDEAVVWGTEQRVLELFDHHLAASVAAFRAEGS